MTPTYAIGFLAAFIVLITAAFHFRFLRVYAGPDTTQLTIRRPNSATLTFFGRTWAMALAGATFAGIALAMAMHPSIQHLWTVPILFGVFAQNYLWPATGAASPTAAQVQNQDSVVVDCTTDGVITTFTLTHNLGITAADIALGFPEIIFEPNSATGIPATLLILITRPIASGNAVIFTCAAIAATFRVRIKRPHSIGR